MPNKTKKKYKIPLFCSSVKAGFPSPAEDKIDVFLDLNKHLIAHPSATFFLRVDGGSMLEAGIFPRDILIVDKSLEPKNGEIVIASLNGEFTVKKIKKEKKKIFLIPKNRKFKPIEVKKEDDFLIWGVVTYVIHKLKR